MYSTRDESSLFGQIYCNDILEYCRGNCFTNQNSDSLEWLMMMMISHVWYSRHKCSACWPWHNTERSREHEQCVKQFLSMNLTHETDTLRISDIKAWNSSAHSHVRHSLIAVLTMWCYNNASQWCSAELIKVPNLQTSPRTGNFEVCECLRKCVYDWDSNLKVHNLKVKDCGIGMLSTWVTDCTVCNRTV